MSFFLLEGSKIHLVSPFEVCFWDLIKAFIFLEGKGESYSLFPFAQFKKNPLDFKSVTV